MGGGLLERGSELEALDDLLRGAAAGHGAAVVVEGPAGIGKSRLLQAAVDGARGLAFEVLTARGVELERELPLGVARQLLEAPVRALAAAARDDVLSGEAAPAAAALGVGAPVADDPSAAAVAHALHRLCLALGERHPLAFMVDDAHWADRQSLAWLAYLARRLEGARVALVVTLRTADADAPVRGERHPPRELIEGLVVDAGARVLRPGPLALASSRQLVRAALGEDIGEDLCTACHEASRGNPFYLTALASELRDRPGARTVTEVRALAPAAIREALMRRLRRLGPAAGELARAVSVLGGRAELRHAAHVALLDTVPAAAAADALAAAEILTVGPVVQFRHPIVQAAVYAGVPLGMRRVLHSRAAGALSDGAPLDAVAAHLMLAAPVGDPLVVERLRAAALDARARGAPDAAAALLRRALDEPPAPELRPRVLVELAMSCAHRGDEAVVLLRDAIELTLDAHERARIAGLRLGPILTQLGRNDEAVDVLRRAREDAAGDEDLGTRIDAAGLLSARLAGGAEAEWLPGVERRAAASGRAAQAELARRAFEHATAGTSAAEAAALAERALAGGALTRDTADASSFFTAVCSLLWADALVSADAHARAAGEQLRRYGWLGMYATSLVLRSVVALNAGRVDDALDHVETALEHRDERGWVMLPLALACRATALIERGELDAAEETIARGGLGEGLAVSVMDNRLLHSRGRLQLARGNAPAALRDLLACGEGELAWAQNGLLSWRTDGAVAAALTGDRALGRELAAEELAIARRFGATRAIGMALRAAGLVERGQREIELLEEAVALLAGSPARLEHARALADLGAALRRAARTREAREPLRQALALADRCGATALVERARAELVAAGGRPRRVAVAGPDALTPSERRVAELAEDGATNRQIAEVLFVTRKTVEVHLSRAYRKLGIGSRRELAQVLQAAQGTETGLPAQR